MSAEELCATCGKKVRAGRAGSLTQWLFTEDSCECDGKRASLKLAEADLASSSDASRMCEFCGRLRSDSRQGSLTQWVFGSERCSCDYEQLRKDMEESGQLSPLTPLENQPAYVSDVSEEEIERLETGPIDLHGLGEDSFPFQRYRIMSIKGRGNSGIVYEAWDCMLRKRVAIKTLYSQSWSPDELMGFQREARATSKLGHRNVLQVLDFGASSNGQPYMVMEFVNGTTLKEIIMTEGSIESSDAVPLFLQICEGIRHAHQNGILHRDIKSSNIMIGDDGKKGKIAKVIDFGIAALAHSHTPDAVGAGSNTIAGSPLYMSPDQFAGLEYDARSEIYSMGCVMFETLCGNVPFEAENAMATMALHARAEIPEFLNAYGEHIDCPEELEGCVRKSLAKDPNGRFKTFDDLHRYLLGVRESIAARKAADSASAYDMPFEVTKLTPFQKYRAPALIVAAVVALVGIGFGSYKLISLLPAPKAVPSTSVLQTYDLSPKDIAKKKLEAKGPFEDLMTTRMIVQYAPKQERLTVDGEGDVDGVLERALKLGKPIKELEIANVEMTTESFSHISQFDLLNSLSISDVSGVSTDSWLSLSKCSKLEHLRLTDTDTKDEFMQAISSLTQLHHVELDNCNVTPLGLSYIAHLPINHLSLKTSRLNSEHMAQVVKMKEILALFVGDSGLKDADLVDITKLTKATTLGLNGLPLSDKTLENFARKLPLTTVYIFRCSKLTKPGIQKFRTLKPYCSIVNEDSDLKNSFAPTY